MICPYLSEEYCPDCGSREECSIYDGTGKAQLAKAQSQDSSLREQIAKIIFNIDPPLFVEWEYETDYVKEAAYIVADKIIALMPDVEQIESRIQLARLEADQTGYIAGKIEGWRGLDQAVKEERERIFPIASKLSMALDIDQDMGDALKEIDGLVTLLWQALKKGEG